MIDRTSTGRRVPRGMRCVCVARQAMACEFSLFLPPGGTAVDAGCSALDEIDRLEQLLSVFHEESELSRVNARAAHEPVRVNRDVFGLLELAGRIAGETSGAFDAASGALVKAWQGGVPGEDSMRRALEASGMRHVELSNEHSTVRFRREGVSINPGAIGKGFAIDRAIDLLRLRFGLRAVLMQGGQSSLRAVGAPAGESRGWKVAIGDPFRPGAAAAYVWLRDESLGTSSSANQFFVAGGRRYGHILDPRTGYPASRLASASALAPTAAEADALSTAFFVMGVEGTRRYCRAHRGIGAVLVTPRQDPAGAQVIAIGLREGALEVRSA